MGEVIKCGGDSGGKGYVSLHKQENPGLIGMAPGLSPIGDLLVFPVICQTFKGYRGSDQISCQTFSSFGIVGDYPAFVVDME